jgi:hypothetical protein
MYSVLVRKGTAGLAIGNERGLIWEPAYSTVAGDLPLTELRQFRLGNSGPYFSAVRVEVEATAESKLSLKLANKKGLTAFLDGDPLPLQKVAALKKGLHTLVLVINHSERKEALRVEIEDTSGVRFVSGK